MSSPSSPPRIEIVFTLVGTTGGSVNIRAEAPRDATWAAIRGALSEQGYQLPERIWIGTREVLDDTNVGSIGTGAVLAPTPTGSPPRDLLRLECIYGPAVGRTHPLGGRGITVGRSAEAAFRLDDPDASRLHCRLEMVAGRVTVTDLDSTNGTTIDGASIGESHELRAGSQLRVANTTLGLVGPEPTRRAVEDGRIPVHRAPVRLAAPAAVRLTRPTPPASRDRRTLPWLVILLPLVIGVGLAWWMKTMMFLAFAIFSPVLMLAQHLADKREGRTSRRREIADYAQAVRRHEARVAEVLAIERRVRERAAPPLIDALRTVRAADQRLWHRHPNEHGYLHWRVGRGTCASQLTVTGADGEERVLALSEAPVVVDLSADRLVGVVAPCQQQYAALAGLLLQGVAWHSPHHLRIAVVSRKPLPDASELVWFPHLGPADGSALFTLDQPDALVEFLAGHERTHRDERNDPAPSLLMVLLGGDRTSAAPELAELIADPRKFGATVVSFADAESHLPDRAHPVVRFESSTCAVVSRDLPIACVPDLPAAGVLPIIARTMAPLEDVAPSGGVGTPPRTAGLAEVWPTVMATDLLDPAATQHSWSRHRRPTMRAVLGRAGTGPAVVDLAVDGPHVLIAGTTGSGKSELLQTMITSLAAANRPDALHFVLIDYKGGAAFRDCARLPHTVGLVTDLDGHLTERALTSLSAELHRRERLMADVGATDLDDYHRSAINATIPRLVLVIDEFRVLTEELPDFVDGLVRLATVGRSLGVHLVLATQRPAGVVSADIRANVNLRIALRVRDDGDSQDVIETSDAARLSAATPGRAFMRCGGGEPILFQSARVTVPPLRRDEVVVSLLADTGVAVDDVDEPTTLHRFVEMSRGVAEAMSISPGDAPWLPPLSDHAGPAQDSPRNGSHTAGLQKSLAAEVSVCGESAPGYAFATADRPALQDQPILGWHPESDQHLAIIGGPRSGRTTAVRGLLTAALEHGVHAYVLDLGRSLTDITDHPCVGAVVGPDEPSRVERLLSWVAEQVAERRRSPVGDRAQLMLIIDGWDVLDELGEDTALFRLLDLVSAVLRDGPAAGVHVLATGGRGLLTSRSLAMFRAQIALTMADNEDLFALGIPRSAVPERMPPGRGVTAPGGMEVQVWEAGAIASFTPSTPVHRIGAAPMFVTDLAPAPDALVIGTGPDGPLGIPLGRRGDLVGLIAGPTGSGRTNALLTVAAALPNRPTCWISADATTALPDSVFRPADSAEAKAWLTAHPGGTLLVDEVGSILDSALEDELLDHTTRAMSTGAVVFAAGDPAVLAGTYRGLVGELRRRGTGVLLMPNRTDGEVFALRCPRLDRPRPGNGFLVRRGELTELQIAWTVVPN